MVVGRCDPPKSYDVNDYKFFQGNPIRILNDNDTIDIGNRCIQVHYTPEHSPGHMCFWKREYDYLFTSDLVYKNALFAYFPSTDPEGYLYYPLKVCFQYITLWIFILKF